MRDTLRRHWRLLAVLLVAVTAVAVGRVVAPLFSTAVDDECSREHARCVAVAQDGTARTDCRIEVYHCRVYGEFVHADGTVVRVGSGDSHRP